MEYITHTKNTVNNIAYKTFKTGLKIVFLSRNIQGGPR